MRAVVQRVLSASVSVEGNIISTIGRGLCVLVGIHEDDTTEDMDYMVKKILGVRVFSDPETGTMWSRGAQDLGLEILCVSQFTLYGTVKKGFKPDFHSAMGSENSRTFYADFLQRMRSSYIPEKIKDGLFGARMTVNIVNDGPVTLELDSRKFQYVQRTLQQDKEEEKQNRRAKWDAQKKVAE